MKHLLISMLIIPSLLILVSFRLQAQEEKKQDDNDANRYMNQNSIESLVNAFDSPERAKWQQPDKVIALFGELSQQLIMDLGAGSGYFTLRLAAKGATVISADVSDSFQDIIHEKLQNDDFIELSDNIELRKVTFDDPGLDKEEVDGILIVNSWHHIDSRTSYMKKILKGVKEGGKIIIVDFKLGVASGPPDSHKLGLNDAIKEIEDLDFAAIKIDTSLLDRQYVIIGLK